MPRFAPSLNLMFNEWPLAERFATAADAGFSAVEVQFPYELEPQDFAARLAETKLELLLINTPRGHAEAGGRGLAALGAHVDAFRADFAKALAYAEAGRARMIHVMSGAGESASETTLSENLRWASAQVANKSITLLLEPLNLRDNPGYFLSDFALAARIIRALGLPNVKLQYDLYHRQILHGDIAVSLRDLLPIIGHVQVAGVPDRHEPIGCEIDFDHIFGLLDALGYEGWVGCEYKPRAGTLEGLGWLARWRQG